MLRIKFLTCIFKKVWATTIGKHIFDQNSFRTLNAGNIEHFFQNPKTVQKNLFPTIFMICIFYLACFRGAQFFLLLYYG